MSTDAGRRESDWFHLSDDEEVVWESRPHVVAMGRALPVGVGLALLGTLLLVWNVGGAVSGAFTAVGAGLVVLGVGMVAVRYLYWTNTRYVITTDELYEKRGVVSREVTQFRLERVQTTSLDQSVVGRLLGYGDLTIYTAGSGDPELTFECVPRPETAGRLLSDELVDTARQRPAGA